MKKFLISSINSTKSNSKINDLKHSRTLEFYTIDQLKLDKIEITSQDPLSSSELPRINLRLNEMSQPKKKVAFKESLIEVIKVDCWKIYNYHPSKKYKHSDGYCNCTIV